MPSILDYGVNLDGSDESVAINAALVTGEPISFPKGIHDIHAPMTLVPGGGIIGVGEATQFRRKFTGGPLIRHPGGNQLGSGIILRDFAITKHSSITASNGDTGIDIGYATAWGGRGDIGNILILNQWDGFKWKGGTMNPIQNVQVLEGKGHGFHGVDARGELVGCLAQYNAGHGYFFYAETQGETGVQLTSCGTFGNQGVGYNFEAAPGIQGANIYMKGVSSSADGTAGIAFSAKYSQIWMTQILIESAGNAFVPYPSFTVRENAPGLYMVANCEKLVASDIFVQTCRGPGMFFDSLNRASFTNVIVTDNGCGNGEIDRGGVHFQANNTNITMSGLIANTGGLQGADIKIGSTNDVTLIAPRYRTINNYSAATRII